MGHALRDGAVRGHRARRPRHRRGSSGWSGRPARACGLKRDVRKTHPAGYYRFAHIPISTWTSGDVFARAYVRWLEIERSVEFLRAQLARASGRSGARRTRRAPARSSGGFARRGLARRDLSRRADRRARAASPPTRSSIRPSTIGPAWRWLCASSRSPTSRSATRASTCRIADTTSEEHDAEVPPRALAAGPPYGPLSRTRSRASRIASGACLSSTTRVAPSGCRACADACPTGAMVATDGGLALDMGRCLFCSDCTKACPEGAIEFTRDYRLACAKRSDLVVSSPAPEPHSDRELALAKEIRRLFGRSSSSAS